LELGFLLTAMPLPYGMRSGRAVRRYCVFAAARGLRAGAMTPNKNSTAACLWLMMLALDADGRRKDVEFDEIQQCLNDLVPALRDDPGRQPEALMAALNRYYQEIETSGPDGVLDTVLHQIDDAELRQKIFVMLLRIAISDRQLHRDENTLLRRIGEAWGLEFTDPGAK
jgi:uncharacterized tellurite resistance protein B-like protein